MPWYESGIAFTFMMSDQESKHLIIETVNSWPVEWYDHIGLSLFHLIQNLPECGCGISRSIECTSGVGKHEDNIGTGSLLQMTQQLLDAVLESYSYASIVRLEQDADTVQLIKLANESHDVVEVGPVLLNTSSVTHSRCVNEFDGVSLEWELEHFALLSGRLTCHILLVLITAQLNLFLHIVLVCQSEWAWYETRDISCPSLN